MKYHQHLLQEINSALLSIFNERRYADKVIEKSFKTHPKWGSRDRRFFAETVYDAVRWWRKVWFLAGLPDKDHLQGINSKNVELTLWSLFLLKNLPLPETLHQLEQQKIKNNYHQQMQKLQKYAQQSLYLELNESIPDWLQKLGQQELGSNWPALMQSLNKTADVFLRTNTLRTHPAELKKFLESDNIQAEEVTGVPGALRVRERKNVFTSKAFKQGLFEVQDAGSQCIAPLLNPQPGERVIDACAGAGGKSLHLAALMKGKGKIIALDIHQWKLDELKVRARRNGVSQIETRVIDSSKVIKRLESHADALLLDVPCSGLGVLKRNPDSKWKLNLEEIERLLRLQREILESYQKIVKPGGRMVYATCSILPSENQRQVQTFLETFNQWKLIREIHINPAQDGFDGFYAALLTKMN